MNDPDKSGAYDSLDVMAIMSKESIMTLPSGNDPEFLKKMPSWNWGACLLPWLWAWSNINMTWGIILLLSGFIPLLGSIVSMASSMYLGFKGNDLAWRYRKFEDIEEFKSVQKAWSIAGYIVVGVPFVLSFILLAVFWNQIVENFSQFMYLLTSGLI